MNITIRNTVIHKKIGGSFYPIVGVKRTTHKNVIFLKFILFILKEGNYAKKIRVAFLKFAKTGGSIYFIGGVKRTMQNKICFVSHTYLPFSKKVNVGNFEC